MEFQVSILLIGVIVVLAFLAGAFAVAVLFASRDNNWSAIYEEELEKRNGSVYVESSCPIVDFNRGTMVSNQ